MVKWSIRGSEQWRGANEPLLATFETVLKQQQQVKFMSPSKTVMLLLQLT